jgi:translocator protein
LSSTTALPPPARSPHWGALGVLAVATFSAAALGGFASIQAASYYQSLNQPAWSPPASVFGPVWSVLYTAMCIAAWLVVRAAGVERATPAMALYATQLVLNALWTWLFFRWHQGALAFAEILLLLAAVIATARAFWRIRPLAGMLMLPYIAWVAFATALSLAMWRLNPTAL